MEEDEKNSIDGNFNITLITDLIWQNRTLTLKIDLVLIGFRMSVVDGFDLYDKLHELAQVLKDTSSSNEFRVCFRISSRVIYKVLAETHPESEEEYYVSKEVLKEDFLKHVYSLIS